MFAEIFETIDNLNRKVVRLETQVREQQLILDSIVPSKRNDAHSSSGDVSLVSVSARTCNEFRSLNPGSESGWYPDGPGYGDDAIYVHCDMTSGSTNNGWRQKQAQFNLSEWKGTTSIDHDTESAIIVSSRAVIRATSPTTRPFARWFHSSNYHQSINVMTIQWPIRQTATILCHCIPIFHGTTAV